MHNVDILRLKADTDIRADLVEVGRLDEPLEALEINYRIIMHALERYRGDGSAKVAVVRCDNVDILGADNNIDRLVLFKAEVHALEFAAEEFDQSSPQA